MAEIEITQHAKERMKKYEISELLVKEAIATPTSIAEGHSSRKTYQKRVNGYVVRVIVEEHK